MGKQQLPRRRHFRQEAVQKGENERHTPHTFCAHGGTFDSPSVLVPAVASVPSSSFLFRRVISQGGTFFFASGSARELSLELVPASLPAAADAVCFSRLTRSTLARRSSHGGVPSSAISITARELLSSGSSNKPGSTMVSPEELDGTEAPLVDD